MKRHSDEFGEREREYLRSLELSLAPDKGKPGTIDALVDDLIDATSTDKSEHFGRFDDPHRAYLELARRGFDGVPTLIEHIDDDRLTRAYKQGFNNFSGYAYRVGDMVCDILQGLAGDDLGRGWLRRLQGDRLEKADVEKWWVDAKKVSEEEYYIEHVIDGSKEGNLKNRLMLDVLAHKYPKRLPGIYRKMLDERQKMFGWEIANVVASSSLSKEVKRELFVHGASNTSLRFRFDAIEHLQRLDSAKALELLLVETERTRAKPDGEFWKCTESRIAHLVRNCNEPTAWAALEKTAKRVDVGLRMEFLENVTRRDVPPETRKAILAFLAKFRDDTQVRNAEDPKYNGPYAGMHGPSRIEVRNFAAQQIAWIFDMDVEPDKSWTDAQWAKLRDDVRTALAKEGIR